MAVHAGTDDNRIQADRKVLSLIALLSTALLSTALVSTALLATGCGTTANPGGGTVGGSNTPSGTGYSGAPIPIDQLQTSTADVICKLLVQCPDFMDIPVATLAGCKALMTAEPDNGTAELVALVKAGKILYDAAAAGQCFAAMTASCTASEGEEPASCKTTFKGTLDAGAACTHKEECKSALCKDHSSSCPGKCAAAVAVGGDCAMPEECQDGLNCTGGKCAVAVVAKVGEPCESAECAKDLVCDYDANPATCKAKGDAGATCNGDVSCNKGLYCAQGAGGSGTCTAQGTAGAACKPKNSPFSENKACAKGFVCVAAADGAGSCKPGVAVGGACASHAECRGIDLSCAGLVDGTGSGKCTVLPGKGGACKDPDLTHGQYFSCLMPYVCSNSVCGDPPGAGKPCSALGQCAKGLKCEGKDKICGEPPGAGEACSGSCKVGFTCDFGTASPVCKAEVCGG